MCLGLGCITKHPLVSQILNKEILTIQILTLWDVTRTSSDLTNKYLPIHDNNNLELSVFLGISVLLHIGAFFFGCTRKRKEVEDLGKLCHPVLSVWLGRHFLKLIQATTLASFLNCQVSLMDHGCQLWGSKLPPLPLRAFLNFQPIFNFMHTIIVHYS